MESRARWWFFLEGTRIQHIVFKIHCICRRVTCNAALNGPNVTSPESMGHLWNNNWNGKILALDKNPAPLTHSLPKILNGH
jgi:hypothetical protein